METDVRLIFSSAPTLSLVPESLFVNEGKMRLAGQDEKFARGCSLAYNA